MPAILYEDRHLTYRQRIIARHRSALEVRFDLGELPAIIMESSNTLKVAHIVSGRMSGGAARGALWLHRALRAIGVESSILSNEVTEGSDRFIHSTASTKLGKYVRMARAWLDSKPLGFYRRRPDTVFSPGVMGYPVYRHPLIVDADIINLHWINEGFVSVRDLKRITKPIVWTLRDMWPMTGGCHYAMDCSRYKEQCGRCPQLNSTCNHDLSRAIIARKTKTFSKVNMTAVGISKWIAECARESAPFRNKRIEVIHNVVDPTEFKPIPRASARAILGIPDKKCILAGAQNMSDPYKGMDQCISALRQLENKESLHLIAFGRQSDTIFGNTGIAFTSLGFLHDVHSLRLAYSAADVFVAPSRAEAFGKTLAEAMACGTPVVAFDATGPKDIVDHQVNGYLAEPFCTLDLALGIEWVIRHPRPEQLARQARVKYETTFAPNVIAMQYLKLYSDLLRRPFHILQESEAVTADPIFVPANER